MERTQHYNLVLFESSDKPTWLENWNSTMSHIDEVLYRISSGGDLPDLSEVVARLEVLESQMSSANLQIQQNANNITSIQESIDTINATLADLASADTTINGRIDNVEGLITNIQTSINSISAQITSLSGSVTDAITQIDSVVSRVSNCERDIASIEESLGNGTPAYGLVSYVAYTTIPEHNKISYKKGDIVTCNRQITDPENYNLKYVHYENSTSIYLVNNVLIARQSRYLYIATDDYTDFKIGYSHNVSVFRYMLFNKLIDFEHSTNKNGDVSEFIGYAIRGLNNNQYLYWCPIVYNTAGTSNYVGFVHPDYQGDAISLNISTYNSFTVVT